MATYANLCQLMPTYANLCWLMLIYANLCWLMLTYANLCWLMPNYANLCQRMPSVEETSQCVNKMTTCIWLFPSDFHSQSSCICGHQKISSDQNKPHCSAPISRVQKLFVFYHILTMYFQEYVELRVFVNRIVALIVVSQSRFQITLT